MSDGSENQQLVSVLIVSTRPAEMASVEKFLSKRGYKIEIKPTLREALASIGRQAPDWMFVSVNFGTGMDRYNDMLKQTFNIEAIFFADELDQQASQQLNNLSGASITARLTGPVVQMRLAQVLAEKELAVRGAAPPVRKTIGVRPSAFTHVKGEATHGKPLVVHSSAENSFPKESAQVPREKVNVMVFESGSIRGYVVIGSNMNADGMKTELEKMSGHIAAELTGHGMSKANFIAAVEIPIGNFADWASARSSTVRNFVVGSSELKTCFIPEKTPLPVINPSQFDPTKVEIKFSDIPVETALPCAFYVHLQQNNKFVCLIKKDGVLSAKQQERLAGLKVSNLVISQSDIEIFKMFYIRQKLAVLTGEESLSA